MDKPDNYTPLVTKPCRNLCNWHRTPVMRGDEPLFACRGCGSHWVPSEMWTPINADQKVSPEILSILRTWR